MDMERQIDGLSSIIYKFLKRDGAFDTDNILLF